jgi:hypothetical protein
MSTPSRRGDRGLWIALAVVALVVVAGIAVAIYLAATGNQPRPAGADTVATKQSLAVAAFLKAYVKDDAATMEKLVTSRNIPWKAPPPALPAGVSTDTVASFIEPYRENGQVVIGSPLVLEVRMSGDGKEPTGTVTAEISARKQPARTVAIGMVLKDGRWLVDTVDGRPVAKAVKSLTQ